MNMATIGVYISSISTKKLLKYTRRPCLTVGTKENKTIHKYHDLYQNIIRGTIRHLTQTKRKLLRGRC